MYTSTSYKAAGIVKSEDLFYFRIIVSVNYLNAKHLKSVVQFLLGVWDIAVALMKDGLPPSFVMLEGP